MPSRAELLPKRPPQIFIEVTEELIKSSMKRNSNSCMTAEALKLRRPDLSRVSVDIQTIRATDDKKQERYQWLTPKAIQQAIVDFDAGKEVKPFRVKLGDGQVHRSFHGKWNPSDSTKKAQTRRNKKRRGTKKSNVAPKAIGSRRAYGLRNLAY